MKNKLTTTLLLSSLGLGLAETSADWTSYRPDGHAPIGVMGEHLHKDGDWMASYRYMNMEMDGISDAQGYTMRPTGMDMEMHMVGAMYGVSDKLTLMFMAHHLDKDMDMAMQANGMAMPAMHSEGWGDLTISGMFKFSEWGENTIFGTFGLGIPTGSIDEKAADGSQLPYGMQMGSGTWDLRPGITYLGQTDTYSWGAQISGLFRTGDNDQDYQLGSVVEGTVWAARKMSDNLSVSARITGRNTGSIDGMDKDIMNAMMSTPMDPENYGGDALYGSLGFNYLFDNGHRIALEYQRPLDENHNGLQMDSDGTFIAGWQYAW